MINQRCRGLTHRGGTSVCFQLPYHADSWHRRCDSNLVDMDAHIVLGTNGTPKGGSWRCPGHIDYPEGRKFLQTSENKNSGLAATYS